MLNHQQAGTKLQLKFLQLSAEYHLIPLDTAVQQGGLLAPVQRHCQHGQHGRDAAAGRKQQVNASALGTLRSLGRLAAPSGGKVRSATKGISIEQYRAWP